jgi:hypothetical protein
MSNKEGKIYTVGGYIDGVQQTERSVEFVAMAITRMHELESPAIARGLEYQLYIDITKKGTGEPISHISHTNTYREE